MLNGVRKLYNDSNALDGVDLRIDKNEIVAVIGPSGGGKTTLLRIIAGLEQVTEGQRIVDGNVGMVFQHCHLWPHKSVLENVMEPLIRVKKMGRTLAEHKAIETLTRFGLGHCVNTFPDTLSGGEIQRVAIVRTLVTEPDVLLLDEITSALDPLLVDEVIDMIRQLAREKRTLVIITHELQFAKEVSDRVVFLHGGKIVEEGHPYRIFTNPEHELTKKFVSSILKK